MASLLGRKPMNTYKDLLQVSNANQGIDETLRPISDGEGTESALHVSTVGAKIIGDLEVTGNVTGNIVVSGLAAVATTGSYADLLNKPTTFPPTAHTHSYSSLTDVPATFAPSAHTHSYSSLTDIPATFTPSVHTHLWADITDKPTTFTPTTHTHAYSSLTGIPATFAPSAHVHAVATTSTDGFMSAADKLKLDGLTSGGGGGVAGVSSVNGFSGAVTLTAADVGAATTSHTHAYSSLTGIPATFTPSAHTHAWSTITATPTTLSDYGITDAASATHTHAYSSLTGTPTLATVATTGSYTDLLNKPTIGSGDVVGPASSVDNRIALYSGTTGKLLKQSTGTVGTAAFAATTDFATAAQGTTADTAILGANSGYVATGGTGISLSDNGRTFVGGATNTTYGGRSGLGRSSGKLYFEIKVSAGVAIQGFGVGTAASSLTTLTGQSSGQWGLVNTTTDGFYTGSTTVVTAVTSFSPAVGDVFGIAVDFSTGSMWASRNGVWLTGDPAAGTSPGLTTVSGTVYPMSSTFGTGASHTLRTAISEFSYAVPSGFSAWGDSTTGNSSPVLSGSVRLSGRVVRDVVTPAALAIDVSAGEYHTKTINANSTFTFVSPPASGMFEFTLKLIHTSGTVTWPTSVSWPANTAPTLTAGTTHLFKFMTDDGGTKWRGRSWVNYPN